MAKLHSKASVVTVGGDNIRLYTTEVTFNTSAEAHDTTGLGVDWKEFSPGLKEGTVSLKGFYDTDAVTGPGAVLDPLLGTVAEFVLQLEGVGTGKPQKSCDVVVGAVNYTSAVAGYVEWVCELTITGAVDTAPQS